MKGQLAGALPNNYRQTKPKPLKQLHYEILAILSNFRFQFE